MTKIFGVFNIAHAAQGDIGMQQMAASLAGIPADHSGLWHDGPIALGQNTFHTTPESLAEEFPFCNADAGLTLVGDIRLDNREVLFAKLGLSKEQQAPGDAQLILLAYLKWREECAVHLLGDFAFVIWDSANQKLCAASIIWACAGCFITSTAKNLFSLPIPTP